MKPQLRNALLLALLPLMVTACSGRVTPATTSRIYETNDTQKITGAMSKAFTQAGYLVTNAKLDKTVTTVETDSKTDKGVVYKYGRAELPGQGRTDCMKSATTKIIPISDKTLHLVELMAVDVTCYHSLGKMNFAVDTNPATYENFFRSLDNVLGMEGKRVGVTYVRHK